MSQSNTAEKPKSIAVVSGKGGSGKTMIAAVIAEVADNAAEHL